MALSEEYIRIQRERGAELERDGHDASDARGLLELFEELQSMHVAHRDRLVRQLGNIA